MEKIDVESTSSHSATCSDIILREGKRVRLIFRPEIVDNAGNAEARVRGRFIYQRRGDADSWEGFEKMPLSSLKKGESFQLELHSDEVLTLRHDLYELARLHREVGIPQGHAHFLKVKDNLIDLLQLTQAELDEFLSANESDAIKILRRVLRWLCEAPEVASKLAFEETELPTLNGLISRANIRAILELWATNADNPNEEFWQRELGKHSFVLSFLFSYPVVVIQGKAYVGGKEYDNRHGSLVDFLARVPSSRNAVLIEIKTPTTPLLGSQYRQDIFPASTDIIGAISQAIHYRESLMDDPKIRESADLAISEPCCVIIAGSAKRELTDDSRRRSFERFRERLLGVSIVTFDEMFSRLEDLHSLFA
jgi:Shedu protein SduA, N-terminal/Shedu protein SduA, C-terminal